MKLSSRLDAIKPSPTLALNARARALAAKGVDVVSFAAGEPDFDTPAFIKQAAIDALHQGFTKYTATAGIPELRQAIADKLWNDNALRFTPDQILVSCGAKHSLYNVFQALLGPGDEVVIFSPYWVSYPDIVRLAGGEPVIVETREEDGYGPDPDALHRAITPRTRAVVINSPSNPSGAVLSDEALRQIADVLEDHEEVLAITDDIYEKLLYTGGHFHNIANVAPMLEDRVVVINGFSKAYAMTGWRVGYAAGPKRLISGMQNIQDQSTSNPTSIAQKAAVAALTGPKDELQKMVAEFKARRDLFVAGLNQIPGITCRMPEGAFYVFPNVKALLGRRYKGTELGDSLRLSEVLLDDFQLAAVPGAPFGAEGHLRLSFATSRQAIERGLERLGKLVSQLS
ncbi:MAG: pyridoxal phosphate-dependent aminotransferase [Myxococcaceae bacterium]|nr:pyridoxal phosphate-dependent aminotransferase [Myxococcaceae bacterium]